MIRNSVLKNRARGIAFAALLAAVIPAALVVGGCGGNNNSTPGVASGVVFVENNDVAAGQNKVLAFRRDGSGNLSMIGSYLTGGTGVSEPALTASGTLDNDREIIVNPQHTRLFAVNQGSDTVAVFNIQSDGSLAAVPGSPFSSGGHAPVSLGLVGNTLVVANASLNPQNNTGQLPNFTSFSVASNGALTPIANSSISIPAGSTPSIALPSPDGSLIFDADFRAGNMRVFQLSPAGVLTQAAASPQPLEPSIFTGAVANAPHFPLGVAVYPSTTQRILYVSAILGKQLVVYTYDANGTLTFVRAVPNNAADPCWIRVSPDGRFLYTSNALSDDISVYSLADPMTPQQIQSANVTGPETVDQNNGNPWQLDVDPTGRFVYDLTPRDLLEAGHDPNDSINNPAGPYNTLHVLQVNGDGTLTQISTSPFTLNEPPNSQPQGVVAI